MKTPDKPLLDTRFARALKLMFELHGTDSRKGTDVPYVTHLMSVAALALEQGADQSTAVAALLHDAVEDHGIAQKARIAADFGAEVAAAVVQCSDSSAEERAPWRERKEKYICHLREQSPAARLITAADKLHNARSILADYRRMGPALWPRFAGGREGVLWYYQELCLHLCREGGAGRLREMLEREVDELCELVRLRESYDSRAIHRAPMSLPEALWGELRQRYQSPPRAYHSFDHIRDCLRRYAEVDAGPGWKHPRESWFALLCHDAIYDATRFDNEEASARWAREVIRRHSLPIDEGRVAGLIELTAQHGKLVSAKLDTDEAHFSDCDLAILAAEERDYWRFAQGVRLEYASLPPEAFRQGRATFLEKLLGEDEIFMSTLFRQRYEERARENLRREAASLAPTP